MSFPVAKLGDVIQISRSSISPDDIASGTDYVGLEHIDSSGNFLNIKSVSTGELASTKFRFDSRHILFGKLRPYLRKTARPEFAGVCSTDILPLLPLDDLDRDYLFYTLRRQSFVDDVTSLCAGANLPRISPKVLAEMKIPMPPLSEQRRIAAVLGKADALRAKRRNSIAKLDQLLQSVFLDMFGDPVSNPRSWPRVPFSEVLEHIESGTSPICLDRVKNEDEWGVLKLGAVTRCRFDPSANKALPTDTSFDEKLEVKVGDLLFTRKNTYELVAACAYVSRTPERLLLPDLIFRLRLKEQALALPRYLQSLLTYPRKRSEVQNLAGGSAGSMPNISKAKLKDLLIELPPLPLQKGFSRIVEHIEQQRYTLQRHATQLDTLFASLQHRAFAGEL